jgi:hypothetical protein
MHWVPATPADSMRPQRLQQEPYLGTPGRHDHWLRGQVDHGEQSAAMDTTTK